MEKQGKERERERIEEMGKRKEAFSNERWKTHFYLNGIRYRAKIIPFDDQRGIEQESRIKRGVDNAKKKKTRENRNKEEEHLDPNPSCFLPETRNICLGPSLNNTKTIAQYN